MTFLYAIDTEKLQKAQILATAYQWSSLDFTLVATT